MPFMRAYTGSQPIDDVSFFTFGEHFLTFGVTFFLWRDFFSLARLFFFGATFFPLARLFSLLRDFFLWHDFFLSCATFFSDAHLYTATRFIAGSKFEHVWLSKDG